MLFGELSDDFLRVMGGYEILKGVPLPISEGGNGQIAVKSILIDMARVVGSDASFVYADKYFQYIKAAAGDQAEPMLVSEGARFADEGRYEDACKLLRTALMIDPKSRAALYLYGRALKACYETASAAYEEGETANPTYDTGDSSGNAGQHAINNQAAAEFEDYIGSFKAESMDTFEVLTMMHPEFAMGYYFLGYAYLNMGLYLKAKLTWDEFIKLSSSGAGSDSGIDDDQLDDLRHEISGMLLDLEEPVEIELGCNQISAGDFVGGRDTLSKFREGRYEKWWPLWYYLGVAEASLGNLDEAISDLRKVLTLTPSNIDVMEELVQLYEAAGDMTNAAKYKTKIEIVKRNRAEEL